MRIGITTMVLGSVMLATPAVAQVTDWCGSPLSVQADPGTALLWRLRCTIQVLDRERLEAEDHITTVEVDKAVTEAHLKEALDEVAALKKAKEEEEKHKEPIPQSSVAPAAPPAPAAPVVLLHKDK